MEWITLGVGIVIGYFVEKLLDKVLDNFKKLRGSSYWRRVVKAWQYFQKLSYGLEVVQMGWNEGLFVDEDVVITLDTEYNLPSDIKEKIFDIHEADWISQNMTNDIQFGISRIDPHRISDNTTGGVKNTHQLRLWGHTYHYFDFLSTHKIYYYGTEEEKIFLQNLIQEDIHYLKPIPSFPNILSVGLSLFPEKGDCLVLTRRTPLASSGGHWSGKLMFNAVGECVSPKDISGDYQGAPRISPWITAKRGLYEEIGINLFDRDKNSSLQLHSLAWDNRILDYKFFGYVINNLSRADVERSWINAPDRNENWNLIFYDTATRQQCLGIINDIVKNRTEWSSEAIFCTCFSLLQLRKITYKDIEKLMGNRV